MKHAFYSRSYHEKVLKEPFFNMHLTQDGEFVGDYPFFWNMFKVKINDAFLYATHIKWERHPTTPTGNVDLPSDAVYLGEIDSDGIEDVDPKTVPLEK